MNSRFVKFKRAIYDNNIDEINKVAQELHKSFASLPKQDQSYANQLLHGIQSGEIDAGLYETVYDYISEQKLSKFHKKIDYMVSSFGVNKELLTKMCEDDLDESNIDEYGRFQKLKNTVDFALAKQYFENRDGKEYKVFEVNMKIDSELRYFIINI